LTEKRFTESEVALVLRRAVELEGTISNSDPPEARGLTLKELQDVALEAGIRPDLVSRAAAELETTPDLEPFSVAGPYTVKKEVRVLEGEATREEIGQLMRVVDGQVSAQGTVVEALGAVRWTSHGRFLSTQVSVEPADGETLLRVEERYSDSIRGPLHGIPAAWGLILGLALGLEVWGLVLPIALVLALVLGTAGWTVGNLVWRVVAARSGSRVARVADQLATEAEGLLPPPGERGEEPLP
jgi:hypothetical protein